MDLTEDAFRALAQSSPWRWRTLHLTHRSPRWGTVEAWLRRPGLMLVRDAAGRDHVVDERDARRSVVLTAWSSDDPDFVSPPPRVSRPRRPHEVEPVRRADGLVGVRPDGDVEYDDPMWQSYDWVAMLDPVELSHHTSVADLRADERGGRATWWARMTALEGYEPRCGCCALLWSFVSDRDEYGEWRDDPVLGDVPDPDWRPRPGTVYPDAYDVALDVQTGVVVELRPVGGNRDDLGFAVRILEVDADLDDVLPA